MHFRQMLDTLARSSAQAVRTLRNLQTPSDSVHDYLYVTTPIEEAFRQKLAHLDTPTDILFLCGSSGDGKSELLTRYHARYQERFDFHLDATHSFQPDRTAIQTLDDLFRKHKREGRPLVVGINIGMLGNYAAEGSREHADILDSMQAFLQGKATAPHHYFLNFAHYPKFEPTDKAFLSPFIQALFQKLTAATLDNPFYVAYQREAAGGDARLCMNFRLLQTPAVQEVIIRTLLQAHLRYDQFLTTRTILDFIHHLLTGTGYLFDNLFAHRHSDLGTALTHCDPCSVRSREIDLFLIRHALGVEEPEFQAFRQALHHRFPLESLTSGSWLRLFYLLQPLTIGNNYHQRFGNDFRSDLMEEYIAIWLLHQHYNDAQEQRGRLRTFYATLIEALLRFANRFAPALSKQRLLFLGEYNGYLLSTRISLRESLRRIADHRPTRLSAFYACLRLGEDDLPPMPINANFLELIFKINRGYRPNKHDKNTIVMLEECIADITRRVRGSHQLHIVKGPESWSLRYDADEDEIRVGD